MDYRVDPVLNVTGYRAQYSGTLVKTKQKNRFKRYLPNHLMYIHHNVAYDIELFQTVHRSLVIAVRGKR